jgi:KDO2-lipid IV(A) lauroyltransferase
MMQPVGSTSSPVSPGVPKRPRASARRGKNRKGGWLWRQVVWPLQAIAVLAAVTIFAALPRRLAAVLGGAIMTRLGPLSKRHERNIASNIAVAFLDLPPERAAALKQQIWRHFGRVIFTYPHLLRSRTRPAFEIEGEGHLDAAADCGAFILVGAHLGHWEVACGYAVLRGHRVTGLYTPVPNPWLDRLIAGLRSRAGKRLTLVPRGPTAARQLIHSLRNGEGVFLIVDQRVAGGELHPFFGVPVPTSTTAARLAFRHNCPIIPCRTLLLPDGGYRISYCEPLRADLSRPAEAEIARLTRSINGLFESWIRESPDQWLCTKRRWSDSPRQPAAPSIELERTAEAGAPALPPAA